MNRDHLEVLAKCVTNLETFVRVFWRFVEPGRPLMWGWFHSYICDALEAVATHEIRRLLINIPPRMLKSTLVSVMFPAWVWLQWPTKRFLTSSYALPLATRDAVRTRRLMQTELYQAAFGDRWSFTGDQNVKSRYENDKTGYRLCTSPTAGTLGEGGDIIMSDDPNDAMAAESETVRDHTNDWWGGAMENRANDPNNCSFVIIQQRTHHEDTSGFVLDRAKWHHLCLPFEYDPDHEFPIDLVVGGNRYLDIREKPGELLIEGRYTEDQVKELKAVTGKYGWSAKFQQQPTPSEGTMFEAKSFGRYTELPTGGDLIYYTSWDLTFKAKNEQEEIERIKGDKKSYVVGLKFAYDPLHSKSYLVAMTRGDWSFKESLKRFVEFAGEPGEVFRHLVEDKANGPALQSMLESSTMSVEMVEPGGKTKIQRAEAVTGFVEAGDVLIPKDEDANPWVRHYLAEMTKFPLYKSDDCVDATSQYLTVINAGRVKSVLETLEELTSFV